MFQIGPKISLKYIEISFSKIINPEKKFKIALLKILKEESKLYDKYIVVDFVIKNIF